MEDMRFLKDNKWLLVSTLAIPVLIMYVDGPVIRWIRNFFQENPSVYRAFDAIDPVINVIANGTTIIGLAVILYLFGRNRYRTVQTAGGNLLAGVIIAGISVQIVKHLFGRGRPSRDGIFIGPTLQGGYESIPSGHSAVAFCFAYVLSRHFPRYTILFYSFSVIVGLERVVDVHHYPADVLAGAVLGVLVGKIMTRKKRSPESRPSEDAVPVREV
jgi:membrane-associated phospholipid phosphatase